MVTYAKQQTEQNLTLIKNDCQVCAILFLFQTFYAVDLYVSYV